MSRAKPSVAALVDEWLDDRQAGRGLAANTEAAYRRDLEAMAYRIAELTAKPPADESVPSPQLGRLSVDDLTTDNLRLAMASLNREGYAASTRARMLSAVRGFCGWLVDEGHLRSDPTRRLENPKQGERVPVAFLSSELERILTTASTRADRSRRPWPGRDRAMVAVLAGAGLRATELISLTLADVLRDAEAVLRVVGKGNKERRVPVGDEIIHAIDSYLAERTEWHGPVAPLAPLFVRPDGKALTRSSLNYLVLGWLSRAGVRKPDGEAAHAFRHTYAKGLVARGVPISTVQQLLGHAHLTSTEVYLRMTAAELHEASRAAEILSMLRHSPAPGT